MQAKNTDFQVKYLSFYLSKADLLQDVYPRETLNSMTCAIELTEFTPPDETVDNTHTLCNNAIIKEFWLLTNQIFL